MEFVPVDDPVDDECGEIVVLLLLFLEALLLFVCDECFFDEV